MRTFLILSLFLFFSSCYEPERNCTNFKTGTFEFEALSGTEVFKTTIIRNDSIEVDFFKGKTDTSSIRWLNDCEYIVKKLNPKGRSEEKAIHMKILTSKGDEYTFEFKEVGKSKTRKGSARKTGN